MTCNGPGQEQSSAVKRRKNKERTREADDPDLKKPKYHQWMRPRCLLSHVDRLPTISEIQELGSEEGDTDCPGTSMDQYMDSIRELSLPPQPCYPLHGPLRGFRRWGARAAPCPVRPHCPGAYAAASPVDLSDVSFTLRERASRSSSQGVVDRLVAQTVFAGL